MVDAEKTLMACVANMLTKRTLRCLGCLLWFEMKQPQETVIWKILD